LDDKMITLLYLRAYLKKAEMNCYFISPPEGREEPHPPSPCQ